MNPIPRLAYISADIEGVAAVVSPAQTVAAGFEYERARRWFTDEVRAVCEGALAAGVDACIVSDSHLNGQNLLIERLPRGTRLVRNWPRPLGMMQGVEAPGVIGAVLLGYHTAARSEGVLAHSFAGRWVADVRVGGEEASESRISAALAGAFGVPVVLATGDDHYVRHIKSLLGEGLPTVATKSAHGRYSATCRHPDDVLEELRRASEAAFTGTAPAPYVLDYPARVEIRFQRHLPAELLSYLDDFERVDATTVAFTAESADALSRKLFFATHMTWDEQLP